MTLLARYKLDGNARDSEGSAHGTAFDVTWAPSQLVDGGGEARLNGTTSRIDTGFQFTNETAASLPVWFRPREGTGHLIGQHDGTNGLAIEQTETGKIRLVINGTAGAEVTVYPGEYHHAVAAYGAGEATLYLDNEAVASVTATVTWPAVPVTIGARADGSAALEGDVVDSSAYDEAMSAGAVASIAWSPSALDGEGGSGYNEEHFEAGIPDNFGTGYGQSGAPSITFDSTNQAMQISGTSNKQYFYDVDSFAARAICTIEAELYFKTDHAGFKHCGIFISDIGGFPGYRIAYQDGYAWRFTLWNSLSDEDGSVNSAATWYTTPSFSPGDTILIRLVFNAGQWTLYLNNQKAMEVEHHNIAQAQPGFHVYGATLLVNHIKQWPFELHPTDEQPRFFPHSTNRSLQGQQASALGWHPNAATPRIPNPTAIPRNGRSTVQGISALLTPPAWFDQRDGSGGSHLSPAGVVSRPDRQGRLSGNTTDQNGQPVSRRVRCFERRTGRIVRETWSNAAGYYQFDDLDPAKRFTVVAHDYSGTYNAVIADNAQPEVPA